MATITTTTTTTTSTNPLRELSKFGQSAWLDYIRRNLITSGELKGLVDHDGLGGVTSNPAIFEKAITGSSDYAEALVELQKRKDLDAMGIYEVIAIKDIQDAADILRPVYDRTKMRDGYVSLEVSPFLARDTAGTMKDARRLWKAVNRPNLLVKIPATAEGIPAIEQMISEGINVTLLFAQEMYEKVAFAYIAGLKKYAASGGDLGHVSSVASFFISRIDSMVDAMVKARLKTSTDPKEQAQLRSLPGKVAIAKIEPVDAAEHREPLEHVKRLAPEAPAFSGIDDPRQCVRHDVEIRRNFQPMENDVVTGVDDGSQARWIHNVIEAEQQLRRADASGQCRN